MKAPAQPTWIAPLLCKAPKGSGGNRIPEAKKIRIRELAGTMPFSQIARILEISRGTVMRNL